MLFTFTPAAICNFGKAKLTYRWKWFKKADRALSRWDGAAWGEATCAVP
jgi:hypothetical protein